MKRTDTENSTSEEKAGDGSSPSRAFSRECRLLKAQEFSYVFAGAYRSADRFFTVLGRVSELPTPRARLGLAIAKKQLRRAVDRNRIKRLIREHFRTQVLAQAGRPLDYVVMARSAVLQADRQMLRGSLARHFNRIQDQLAAGNDTDQPVP